MTRVLYLDPYHGPSHRALSVALRDHSRHEVTLLALPPRKWKWRMRGAAFAFEPLVRALPARLPIITIFHENQITYPPVARDDRDFHFGLVNIYTALASDRELDRRGADFRMMVMGQSFREQPACFAEAARDLSYRIEGWGFVASRREYLEAVARWDQWIDEMAGA